MHSLSIITTFPVVQRSTPALVRSRSLWSGALVSALLTPLSLLILGYHPYAEDGGLYLAGVEYLLNPSLFPHLREFVTAPLQYSAFAPCLAFLVRHSGASFEQVVFSVFLLCLWATIFAAWRLAQQCFRSLEEQLGATLLVALWLSLPVAGTSLMLIDPYLTARSVSTPLVLLAVAATLAALDAHHSADRRGSRSNLLAAVFLLALAASFHPLMAGYGAAFVISILWIEAPRPRSRGWKAVCLIVAGLALASVVHAVSPLPSASSARVALTRSYWFLAQWEWFEVLGLIAPLLILAAMLRSRRFAQFHSFARATIAVGVAATVIALCFARANLNNHGVAHLQPLRVFQVIYFALLLALGGWLARIVLRTVWWRWILASLVLGVPVAIPAWLVFPHSPHLELWLPAQMGGAANQWVAAFRWIRENTPADALFALDANYISDPTEDAQSFRAIAERSALPDFSKDGGEAAVNTNLSEAWVRGVDAQQALSSEDDSTRLKALKMFDVTWLVLHSSAPTESPCPYDNGTVKVCHLSGTPDPIMTRR